MALEWKLEFALNWNLLFPPVPVIATQPASENTSRRPRIARADALPAAWATTAARSPMLPRSAANPPLCRGALAAMTAEAIVVILAALLIGTVSKAITGFGLPLVAIPVMAAFIGVETAVVVMAAPSTYSNVVLLREFREAPRLPGLGPGIALGLAGVALGTWLLSALAPGVLALGLASWIGLYLISQVANVELPARVRERPGFLIGATGLGGVFQGATGIAGPVIVTALHAMRLERRPQLFALAAVFGAFGAGHLVTLWMFGLFTRERLLLSAVATVPVMLGLPIGLWLGRRMSVRTFNRCVLALLAVTGVKLVYDGLRSFGP